MNQEEERTTVIELHKFGMKTTDIVRTMGFNYRNVYNDVKGNKETSSTRDGPRTVTTPENIKFAAVFVAILRVPCEKCLRILE